MEKSDFMAEVAEIQLHHEPFYFLIILEKNGKNMEINLASASFNDFRTRDISVCLKSGRLHKIK